MLRTLTTLTLSFLLIACGDKEEDTAVETETETEEETEDTSG